MQGKLPSNQAQQRRAPPAGVEAKAYPPSVSEQPPHHTGQTSEVNAGYARLTSSRGGVVGDIGRIRSREKTQRNNRRTSRLICPCGTHATTSLASDTSDAADATRRSLADAGFEDSDVSVFSHRRSFPRGSSVRRVVWASSNEYLRGGTPYQLTRPAPCGACVQLRNPRSHDGCGEGARARPCREAAAIMRSHGGTTSGTTGRG